MGGNDAVLRVVMWFLLCPIYAAVGLWVVICWAARRVDRVRALRGTLEDALVCPAGHVNATVGRWNCDVCGGDYAGWVGECTACGDASADWFACERCALAIRLPWRSRGRN